MTATKCENLLQVGETLLFKADTEVTRLPMQLTWLHVCVAVSCNKNQISAVVNGVKVLDKQYKRTEKTTCPTSLVGNLVLMKGLLTPGIWAQNRGRVTNVNIFSGLMSLERMVSRTSGEDCGKPNGDLLSWANSSWSLAGVAKWTDVTVEDLCREFSSIQLLTTSRVTEPDDCKRLCQRIQRDGRMASVETTTHFKKLQNRLRAIPDSASIVVWLPILRQNDIWVDRYTEREISMTEFNPGFPMDNIKQACGVYGVASEGYSNFECSYTGGAGGLFCACDFSKQPFLKLRGRCKDSFLDWLYLPQNSPWDGQTTYYGNVKTIARFVSDDNQWMMKSNFYNTTALSKEISGRFMLGKQNWTVEGDSKKCHEGEPYKIQLKLHRG